MHRLTVLLAFVLSLFLLAATTARSQPAVEFTDPARNELRVYEWAEIYAGFSEDMDPDSFVDTTFVVQGSISGLHRGSILYHSSSRTATLIPDMSFVLGELVAVTLTTDIRCLNPVAGEPDTLVTPYVWSFTVRSKGGPAELTSSFASETGIGPSAICAADLNGDDSADLAVPNNSFSTLTALYGGGCEDSLFARVDCCVGSNPSSVVALDIDQDGDLDLAVGNDIPVFSPDSISLVFNEEGSCDSCLYYTVPDNPRDLCAADLNGDGYPDLAVACEASDSVSVLINDREGYFHAPVNYEVSNGPRAIVALDVDEDSDVDLAVVDGTYGDIRLLFNDGFGSFTVDSITYAGALSESYCITAADLDWDGHLDVAVAGWGNRQVAIWWGEEGGLDERTTVTVDHYPTSLIAADLNGDPFLELVTVSNSTGNASVLINNGGRSFEDYSVASAGTAPVDLCSADLDGDGDMDLAVPDEPNREVLLLVNSGAPLTTPGTMRCAKTEMRVVDALTFVNPFFGIFTYTVHSDVEILRRPEGGRVEGYTDSTGFCTLKVKAHCRDHAVATDGLFFVTWRVYDSGGTEVARSGLSPWFWISEWGQEHEESFSIYEADLRGTPVGEYEDFEVHLTSSVVGVTYDPINDYRGAVGNAWVDSACGWVRIHRRQHADYQQLIEICEPLPEDVYTLGTEDTVVVLLRYYDPEQKNYYPCTETPVCISICPERGFNTTFEYQDTDSTGKAVFPFTYDGPLDDGVMVIAADDQPKDDESIEDRDGEKVFIKAVQPASPPAPPMFGIYALPLIAPAPGDTAGYIVAVTSVDYTGSVDLSLPDLPPGAEAWLSDTTVTVPLGQAAGTSLFVAVPPELPESLYHISISGTDGSLTEDVTVPLFVESDPSAPGAVSDLRGVPAGPDGVFLVWTAPGDDEEGGGWAREYDLRFSNVEPGSDTAGWWAGADTASLEPIPSLYGEEDHFRVTGLLPETEYFFALKAADEVPQWSDVSNFAAITGTGVPEEGGNGARVFSLSQNYPNPFNPVTHVRFSLAHASRVDLGVYNVLGQRVSTLAEGEREAGEHLVVWEGRNHQGCAVAPGIYFCRLEAGHFVSVRKMVVVK